MNKVGVVETLYDQRPIVKLLLFVQRELWLNIHFELLPSKHRHFPENEGDINFRKYTVYKYGT